MVGHKFGAALALLGLVAGCTPYEDRVLFDGNYYRSKVSRVDKQNDVFTVLVRNVSQSVEGAREAGRYYGTDYCIKNYGTSNIKWTVGPDTDPSQLQIVDDTLTFQGTCPQ